MRKTYIVSQTSKWQAKAAEAGLIGRCPDILRHSGTDWDKVARDRAFWQKVIDNPNNW